MYSWRLVINVLYCGIMQFYKNCEVHGFASIAIINNLIKPNERQSGFHRDCVFTSIYWNAKKALFDIECKNGIDSNQIESHEVKLKKMTLRKTNFNAVPANTNADIIEMKMHKFEYCEIYSVSADRY